MRFFTVHERPAAAAGGEDVVLVGSGFSWAAALLTPLWLLWHRQWLGLIGYLGLMLPLGFGLELIGIADPADLAIGFALSFLFGTSAADLRRWTLRRNGWAEIAVVAGRDALEAELRYRSEARHAMPVARPPVSSAAPPLAGPPLAGPPLAGGSFDPLPRLV